MCFRPCSCAVTEAIKKLSKYKKPNNSPGARQGTILSPLTFIMFTNDFTAFVAKSSPKYIGAPAKVIIYADDLTTLINPDSQRPFFSRKGIQFTVTPANGLILMPTTQNLCFRTRGRDDHYAAILSFQLDSALTWNRHIDLLSGVLAKVLYLGSSP